MLNGNAATQGFDALDVAVGDRLAVIEEPVHIAEGDGAIDLLKDVQGTPNRLVVGGVQAERPAVLREQLYDRLEIRLHGGRHLGTRLQEILEVGSGVDQHLARTVHPEIVVPGTGTGHRRPGAEVVQLLLRFLGKQIIGESQGEQALLVQGRHHGVVLRVLLESPTRVNHTGEAEAVEFAHQQARRRHVLLGRELRPFGQRSIENRRVGLRDEQPGRVACLVALDFAAWRIRCVFGVADGTQRRAIEEGAVIEVEDEDRRVRCDGIDFIQGWHAVLGKLEFRPAAHHAHPLGGRRLLGLRAQHAQGIGQRGHPIPPQFHSVVEPAANRVHVRIVQPRDDGPPANINDLRLFPPIRHDLGVGPHGHKAPRAYGYGCGERAPRVLRCHTAIEQDEVRPGGGLGGQPAGREGGGKSSGHPCRTNVQEGSS